MRHVFGTLGGPRLGQGTTMIGPAATWFETGGPFASQPAFKIGPVATFPAKVHDHEKRKGTRMPAGFIMGKIGVK